MWCRTRSYFLVGLFVLLQLSAGAEKPNEDFYKKNENIFQLQKCVERVIEKIVNVVEDFYTKIKSKYKCIPDEVPDTIMEILKRSINCVDRIGKKLEGHRVSKNTQRKFFLKCLRQGKKEVHELMSGIDPDLNHCPENVTEKAYQINITASFFKSFNINIKNGLEITRKVVYFGNGTSNVAEREDSLPERVDYSQEESGNSEYIEYDKDDDYVRCDGENTTETGQNASSKNGDLYEAKKSSYENAEVGQRKGRRNKQTEDEE